MAGRAFLVLVLALALASCSDAAGGKGSATGGPVTVVANFYPVAEAAKRIGGDRVQVTNLTPAGAEPHDIELTTRQVDRLEDADLVIYLGRGFQPAVEKVAERRAAGKLDLLEKLDLEKGAVEALGDEEAEAPKGSDVDPHFWLDPQLMADAAGAAAGALAAVAPDDADVFRANAARYTDELRALDGELQQGLARCQRREIVTSHAAFFYLARRYGLTQLPIAGLSPEAEPDAGRLASLTDQIRAKAVTTVFYEDLVSPRVARALAREAGVRTAVLSPLEGLSKKQAGAGKDYAAVMRDNLTVLRKALGCR
ncbi:MAG TPA: zinc ABC transporter substrate-binding protein [Acidimicrobiales bacterium]|nr:zinc ABC transporter substrate-binding protein [Acidimicrobiales bacterium]